MTKTIAVLALPGVQMLDVSGPLDVFAQANAELGRPYYALRVVAYEPGPVRSSSGVRLLPDAVVGDALPRLNTLLVAGTPHASGAVLSEPALRWLRATARDAKRYGSVCTGAFMLAAAGLLDGRRVTTHWSAAGELRRAYPRVEVEEDALHVRDGKLRTAAGVTAGLDLALSLVEEDLGREVAVKVASQLVMFFKRPGGQLQFSRQGQAGPVGRSVLQEVQRWVAAHPQLPLSVEALARHAGLSPRHFARLFHAEVGVTPAAWVEMTRIAAARALLEGGRPRPSRSRRSADSRMRIPLRRAFVTRGVSPAMYRRYHGGGPA